MTVLQEFQDTESASSRGRTEFGKMLAFLSQHRSKCWTILVEKTDRLYRNIGDYALVDDRRVTVHFVKENTTISPESQSSDQLVHGIKVLMARNYSQNLGEETLKGMRQKAKSGMYPSNAPAGYRNTEDANGRRVIVPSSDAPVITLLFEEFASGRYSLKEMAAKARREGWKIGNRPLHKSTLHLVLRKRIYTGDFDWNNETYKGSHEPLVTRETWEQVQAILDRRAENKQHRIKHDFAFSGFVRCGHCGCHLVGELKKGRYVYYHCTGHRGKCPEPYTREEALQEQFATSLKELVIPPGVLPWLQEAVAESDLTQRGAHSRELSRLEEQHRRIDAKLQTLYDDRLDARITAESYDRKARDLRSQALELSRRIDNMRGNAPAPVDAAINVMELTSRAGELFLVQPAEEKQALLHLVLKSASWAHGQLQTEFENPFEALRCSNRLNQTKQKEIDMKVTDEEIWLPGMDSNHELDKILKCRNLLILKSRRSRQKHQKQVSGTKSVQRIFKPPALLPKCHVL
jgi:DNA invertase Pin-like site-specific DNA recombinase